MAFDGITVACLVQELNRRLKGGRISKIAQPEKDELQLTVKADENLRLLISANATLPLMYITEDNKQSPMTAPAFCMLLRKHFNSARILAIRQGHSDEPSLERTVDFYIEHLDEMGDLKLKHLIVEIMGKYSNIILCDEEYKILDSIKRVNSFMSSVREVLPGRDYFLPGTEDRAEVLTMDLETFRAKVLSKNMPVVKAIYTGLTGISPQVAEELIRKAGMDGRTPACEIDEDFGLHLYKCIKRVADDITEGTFSPLMLLEEGVPSEFSVIPFTEELPDNYEIREYTSVSRLLSDFYSERNAATAIRQKSADLRKIVNTAIEREAKKLALQQKQMEDTAKRDKYRVYGELLTAYGYNAEQGSKELKAFDYYSEKDIIIPLDSELTPIQNAKKYFDRYAKLKRTFEALSVYIEETKKNLEHLNSIALSLEIATDEGDLAQIKKELTDNGYIRFKNQKDGRNKGKAGIKSRPLHFVSPEGINFYVGKNNIQNDELTFGLATNNDWWFHAKGCPGSHVIMQTGNSEVPDSAFEYAGALAAHFSSAAKNGKVEVDYVKKKEIKKPANAKPGFVIYHTNYSLVAATDISALSLIP
ncbi:MAG: NFACT family protein [Lachnospiraceae bacterium]|nr:NFACT family protein [Lachnospiraceae bacterium]